MSINVENQSIIIAILTSGCKQITNLRQHSAPIRMRRSESADCHKDHVVIRKEMHTLTNEGHLCLFCVALLSGRSKVRYVSEPFPFS